MAKLKEPPFVDSPSRENKFWTLSWFEWLRDIQPRINERPKLSGTVTEGNYVTVNSDQELVDSGETAVDKEVFAKREYVRDYTGERYLTENLAPEAGTEEGARHGSFRIGLLTEDDFAYFDENGKLICYGNSQIQIFTPVHADSGEKWMVFDVDGNLKYRTSAEVSSDLSGYLATRDYVGERYITENLLDEAGTEPPFVIGNFKAGTLLQEECWHAYGGFQGKSETIDVLGAGQWAWITNITNDLWTGLEGDGISLIGDIMTIENGGDYAGSLSMTLSGLNGKDFQIRFYNITQATQMGYVIGASTTGATNYTNITLPLYLELNAGDQLRLETTCLTDASDPTFRSAVFYIAYLHD